MPDLRAPDEHEAAPVSLGFTNPSRQRGPKFAWICDSQHGLQIVRRILNLAAGEWMDEQGLTWLAASPKIKLMPDHDKRQPYPLNWEEQTRLFRELPSHLADKTIAPGIWLFFEN